MRLDLFRFSSEIYELATAYGANGFFQIDTNFNTIGYGIQGRDAEVIRWVSLIELESARFDIVAKIVQDLRKEVYDHCNTTSDA